MVGRLQAGYTNSQSEQIQTNAFDTDDEDYSNAGILVDTTLSMINHSCIPNAAVRLAGRRIVLRAMQDIKEGEEIEISYVGKSYN